MSFRYEVLRDESDMPATPHEEIQLTPVSSSSTAAAAAAVVEEEPLPVYQPNPTFSDAGTPHMPLPTYEQVQSDKAREFAASSAAAVAATNAELMHEAEALVGTDSTFLMSFFVCLIFDILGVIFCMCFGSSAATKFGVVAGLGSALLARCAFVMYQAFSPAVVPEDDKYHQSYVKNTFPIIALLGFLLMIYGFGSYRRAKLALRRRIEQLSSAVVNA
ncbi:hypothetical protein CAOG_04830 [Capsaspora owczarzaki ATCC 30864]|uniref:Transmembrane protein n=1 Tax=Capsaspora owczarzaki (strain ATCC 30864) TaxID=595528 RepID=A0A0D2WQW4_CAPO3|nr:hypothetical protein CAOG_04830 [Capsaspora owczarzaki ATCC 30864]KJE94145.1 hypothetical protein CAOG_004830 [Capsaspora owczarzaki ATCC 30864]|eukprot:XP_004347581.2 hypothetical protein CAOG_04830 [Capsaspora owczarzaki ATCC 30864]